MSAVGNQVRPGNDRVMGVHLMNMEYDAERGLRQETVYDFYDPEIQRRQVKYVGLYLANVIKQRGLAEAPVQISDDWTDVSPRMRPTDPRFSRHEIVKLNVFHPAERMQAILNFWQNTHKQGDMEWLRQPALWYTGCIAWLMPTPHPAILYRPGEENRNAVLQFIWFHFDLISQGLVEPSDWQFPAIPI